MDAHKLNSRYSQKSRHNTEEDAPRSLSQSQKEYARAPKRGRRERLESEIGGVFVVFVGGGDLRNVFFWRQFLCVYTAVTFRGGKQIE